MDWEYAHRTTQVWSMIFPFTRLQYVRMPAMGVSPRVALCRTVSTASCPSHKQQQLLVLLARPLCGWQTLWTERRPCAVTRHPLMEQAFLNTSLLLQAHWGPCHDVVTKVHMVYTIKISLLLLRDLAILVDLQLVLSSLMQSCSWRGKSCSNSSSWSEHHCQTIPLYVHGHGYRYVQT